MTRITETTDAAARSERGDMVNVFGSGPLPIGERRPAEADEAAAGHEDAD